MACNCECQCSCNNNNIPFSQLLRDKQERLRREGGYGLSEKLLDAEGRKGRARLNKALALDERERRQIEKSWQSFNDSFDKG